MQNFNQYCIYEVECDSKTLDFTDTRPSNFNKKCKGMVLRGNTKTMLKNGYKIIETIEINKTMSYERLKVEEQENKDKESIALFEAMTSDYIQRPNRYKKTLSQISVIKIYGLSDYLFNRVLVGDLINVAKGINRDIIAEVNNRGL